jgi:hypothetical protein
VPQILLGIHLSRLDLGSRDLKQDGALGLNRTWYADIMMRLTEGLRPVGSGLVGNSFRQ